VLQRLIMVLALSGCVTSKAQVEVPDIPVEETPNVKYKVGECTYLVDPENNYKGRKDDAMRVEEITSTHYIYRWWVDQGGWALDTNTRTHEVYERITKRLDKCPG